VCATNLVKNNPTVNGIFQFSESFFTSTYLIVSFWNGGKGF